MESNPLKGEKLFFTKEAFSKIDWIEGHREFEWNDKLYDVSKIEETAKGFDVFCVNDSFEESFIAMFDQWKKSNSPIGKTKAIFQPQFCNTLTTESTNLRPSLQFVYFFRSTFYSSPIAQAPSPPPKPLS